MTLFDFRALDFRRFVATGMGAAVTSESPLIQRRDADRPVLSPSSSYPHASLKCQYNGYNPRTSWVESVKILTPHHQQYRL